MMKKIKDHLMLIAVFALLFTSCSKDENSPVNPENAEVGSLSFATVLNDLAQRSQQKDHTADFPLCSDAKPSYVKVEITGVGYDGPAILEIPVSDSPGDYDGDSEAEYFTLESSDLELPAGTYILEFFAVYDANDNLIWVAPSKEEEGKLSNYVDHPLPLEINLSAGTKKYVDVDVLCYDKRMVNQYGYLFFELETNKALDFCFFANYCIGDRHFVANYSVSIWLGDDSSGTPLYTDVPAPIDSEGEFSADPLCFALPSPPEGVEPGEPYLYYEVTLQPWNGYYPNPGNNIIPGTLSLNDIEANFDGEDRVDFEHLRFGCEPDQNTCAGQDDDKDGLEATCDNCPNIPNPDQENSDGDKKGDACDLCPNIPNEDPTDSDKDGVPDACDNCKDNPGDFFGCPDDECIGEDPDKDSIPASCDICDLGDDRDDADKDGVPDACDNCKNEPGSQENGGCPDDSCIGEDSDGDDVADICDVCEGGDDNKDENRNGIPDDCENPDGEGACETAFMFGDTPINTFSNANRWGWAEMFDDADGDSQIFKIWAGAGQNKTEKGTHVGNATVTLNDDGDVELDIDIFQGYSFKELHVNLSEVKPSGKTAKAPGQYNRNGEVNANQTEYTFDFNNSDGNFWIIVHAVTCGISDAN
jgi:hypothetical protein